MPNLFSIITQTVNIPTSRLLESSLKGADVIIEPIITGSHPGADFGHTSQYIQHGEEVARQAIARIKKALNA